MTKRKLKKTIVHIISLLLIVTTITSCINSDAKDLEPTVEGSKFIMDTIVTVKLFQGGNEDILNKMFAKLDDIDKLMSLNNVDSDVNQININAGIQSVLVSNDTKNVIEKAIEYSDLSNGYFDVSFGPLINLWDIGAENPKIPSEENILEALQLIDYKSISTQGNFIGLDKKSMSIDLGGIAKGYAADQIADIAKESGVTSGIINLGGNILVIGSKVGKENGPFKIGIQNPFAIRNGYLGVIKAENQTVVTSGNYERYFELDGKRYHHILNKDTGYPTDNGVAAISIITTESIDADALSTLLFILGIEEGLALVETLEDIDCLYITMDQEIVLSSGMKDIFVLTDKQFHITKFEGNK